MILLLDYLSIDMSLDDLSRMITTNLEHYQWSLVVSSLAIIVSLFSLREVKKRNSMDDIDTINDVHIKLNICWDLLEGDALRTTIPNEVKNKKNQLKAKRLIDECLRLRPKFAPAYRLQGLYFHARKRITEAEDSFRMAIKLDTKYSRAYSDLGQLIFLERNNIVEAEKLFIIAVKLDCNDEYIHNNFGRLLEEKGELIKAKNHYRKAIKISPDTGFIYNNLGVVLFKLGEQKDAKNNFNKAISNGADSYNVKVNQSLLFEHLEDFSNAE